jgi:hypothetical protein
MTTDSLKMPETPRLRRKAWARISRLEVVLAALAGVVMVGLTLAEPDILEAPFENERTLLFTFGGTALAAVALALMLAVGVPAIIRVIVLGVPFVVVSWWLISPFFIDEQIEDRFDTSIAAAQAAPAATPEATTTTVPSTLPALPAPTVVPTREGSDSAPPAAATPGPVLLGAGRFVGLAGHDGTGDAGIFRTEGSHLLRLENLDIDNGPDLRLYLLPGADQVSPDDKSVYLGPLRGNVGNLTYDLPGEFRPTTGPWTVLVWCEAFDVEFVGATLTIN